MAQATWDAALTGTNSNANQQGQQSLTPSVSRIVVQGSKGVGSSDPHKPAEESDSDSDDDSHVDQSQHTVQKPAVPEKVRIEELSPMPAAKDASIAPAPSSPTHRHYAEAPTVLNPIRVQLSPASRPNLQPQTPTGGSMRILDAAEAMKTSAKVCIA